MDTLAVQAKSMRTGTRVAAARIKERLEQVKEFPEEMLLPGGGVSAAPRP